MDTLTKTPANGPSRKTLASQLDRLEGMLDGFDTALAEAVPEAVEQAVKQAVQAEVLTNHDLQVFPTAFRQCRGRHLLCCHPVARLRTRRYS
jgi:hypothetical protein